jgi:hypothetical protein
MMFLARRREGIRHQWLNHDKFTAWTGRDGTRGAHRVWALNSVGTCRVLKTADPEGLVSPFYSAKALGATNRIKHNKKTQFFYLDSGRKMKNPYVMLVWSLLIDEQLTQETETPTIFASNTRLYLLRLQHTSLSTPSSQAIGFSSRNNNHLPLSTSPTDPPFIWKGDHTQGERACCTSGSQECNPWGGRIVASNPRGPSSVDGMPPIRLVCLHCFLRAQRPRGPYRRAVGWWRRGGTPCVYHALSGWGRRGGKKGRERGYFRVPSPVWSLEVFVLTMGTTIGCVLIYIGQHQQR